MSESINNDLSNEELLEQLASEVRPDLKPCTPEHGLERYLSSKRSDITENTIQEYETKLGWIVDFLKEQGVDDLRELDGRLIDDIVHWRRYESSDQVDELCTKTMRDEMYRLRDWIRYLEKIDAVKAGVSESVPIPELSDGDGVRDTDLDPSRAESILQYLEKYEYATLTHAIWVIAIRTGRRTGCMRALDCDDAHLEGEEPYLDINNRPETGTRLKNGDRSEREVSIRKPTAEVILDFIENNRPDVTDDYDREPLLATQQGRVSASTIRRTVYSWSRPCAIDSDCPHERDPDVCEATESEDDASKCPSSRSPHSLKHGYISEGRRRGVRLDVLSDRCDVSEEVIREHYDETTESEQRKMRRKILDENSDESGGGYL